MDLISQADIRGHGPRGSKPMTVSSQIEAESKPKRKRTTHGERGSVIRLVRSWLAFAYDRFNVHGVLSEID